MGKQSRRDRGGPSTLAGHQLQSLRHKLGSVSPPAELTNEERQAAAKKAKDEAEHSAFFAVDTWEWGTLMFVAFNCTMKVLQNVGMPGAVQIMSDPTVTSLMTVASAISVTCIVGSAFTGPEKASLTARILGKFGGSASMEDYRLHLKEQERQKRQREGRASGGTGGDGVQTRKR